MPFIAAVIDCHALPVFFVFPDFVIAFAGPIKFVAGIPQEPLYLTRVPHLVGINADFSQARAFHQRDKNAITDMTGSFSHILSNRQGASIGMLKIVSLESHPSDARNIFQKRNDEASLGIPCAAQKIRPMEYPVSRTSDNSLTPSR